MTTVTLPAEFADLLPFSEWCLRTETERNTKRIGSPFAAITAFANAALPRVDAIVASLDSKAAEGDLPSEWQHLHYLLMSLAEVAPAIESYDPQATVIDGYDSAKFTPDESHRLRPKL
jgi:hypothetical protein